MNELTTPIRSFAFLILVICYYNAKTQSVPEFFTSAKEAYQRKDYAAFYTQINEASKLHPYHQGILYYKGIAAAVNGKPDEAVVNLKKAVLINIGYNLNIEDLKSLESREDFRKLKAYQNEMKAPIIQSDTILLLSDRTLHAEAVAFDPVRKNFYVASLHKRKIVRVSPGNKVIDFTTSGQDGLSAVMAVEVDNNSTTLWATASPLPEMEQYDSTSISALYEYDLSSQKLRNVYAPIHSAKSFVLGDLTLSKQGDVYVSDTQNNTIFRYRPTTRKLEPFFTSDEFWNIQGICFSADEHYLFISDYIKGLYRVDINDKSLIPITCSLDVSLKGIDGLLFSDNSLIAIQNGVSPMRVTQFFLNADQTSISSFLFIDRAHPAFNEPTNGCMVAKSLYYVANSQWSGYDEDHQLKPAAQLQDIVILKKALE